LLKFQAPNIKSQINPNDPNSKSQTGSFSSVVSIGFLAGLSGSMEQRDNRQLKFRLLELEIYV
jgi:hypothetical protein